MSSQTFDIDRFRNYEPDADQYQRQLARLRSQGKDVDSIESTVNSALENLSGTGKKSFVIYGEPQSGKTEMMICLTARLLDSGREFILHLLNDSLDLLGQNLGRFQASGIAPAAKNYTDILDPAIQIQGRQHVIFCKKNPNNLDKVIQKIGKLKNIVVIDDEADYASPNATINKKTKTRINELITTILGDTGDYIGVTATPARLDLNNTFDNDSSTWVNFPPHNEYTGQDTFFPLDTADNIRLPYTLATLPENYDAPKFARRAFFSFLVNVAHLNRKINPSEENYSMLIHTSGKKIDHKADWYIFDKTIAALIDKRGEKFESYLREIWQIARDRYPDVSSDELTNYVVEHISRYAILILNSDRDFTQHGASATKPSALFTIIIGGNIVSRGVTFENLLSMYFTRDSKHKLQQDTYIQRARMFGSRKKSLSHFELTIPERLYVDWHRCFVFHRLALASIRGGLGSLFWLSDSRISPVSSSSVDKANVVMDNGEMSFELFEFDKEVWEPISALNNSLQKLKALQAAVGEKALPHHVLQYVEASAKNTDELIGIHVPTDISNYKDAKGLDKAKIIRKKKFYGESQLKKFTKAVHHFGIYYNDEGKARVIYKFVGNIGFLRNIKHEKKHV